MVRVSTFLGVAALLSSVLALPMPSNHEQKYPAVYEPAPQSQHESAPPAEQQHEPMPPAEQQHEPEPPKHEAPAQHEQSTVLSTAPQEHQTEPPKHETPPPQHEQSSVLSTAPPAHETEPAKHDVPPPVEHQTTQTSSAYGSGSTQWDTGYNDCVEKCVATYGVPKPTATYTPVQTTGHAGSTGTGATHTVIVAPTQGVLRFVPFTVNAAVGDTVMFNWGANNHTVTKGSALLPCNRSVEDNVFASGVQNAGFSFTQVVNSTEPTYFFCGTPGHCAKGMFGIINPPVNSTPEGGIDSALPKLTNEDTDLFAQSEYVKSTVGDNAAASGWGKNIDVSQLPEWSHPLVASNVLYMRTFLGLNPETLQADGSVSMSALENTPMMWPEAVSNSGSGAANNAGETPVAETPAAGPVPSTAETTAEDSTAPPTGAGFSNSPRVFVAVFAAVATFFLL